MDMYQVMIVPGVLTLALFGVHTFAPGFSVVSRAGFDVAFSQFQCTRNAPGGRRRRSGEHRSRLDRTKYLLHQASAPNSD
jgi:hypothetical protein